jgi:hypothetical protein
MGMNKLNLTFPFLLLSVLLIASSRSQGKGFDPFNGGARCESASGLAKLVFLGDRWPSLSSITYGDKTYHRPGLCGLEPGLPCWGMKYPNDDQDLLLSAELPGDVEIVFLANCVSRPCKLLEGDAYVSSGGRKAIEKLRCEYR